jgi:hypothetical protein
VQSDAARPVLQVGSSRRDHQATGLVRAQLLGNVHGDPPAERVDRKGTSTISDEEALIENRGNATNSHRGQRDTYGLADLNPGYLLAGRTHDAGCSRSSPGLLLYRDRRAGAVQPEGKGLSRTHDRGVIVCALRLPRAKEATPIPAVRGCDRSLLRTQADEASPKSHRSPR